jgi:hypothetical protein
MLPEQKTQLERHRIIRDLGDHCLRVDILAFEGSGKSVDFRISPSFRVRRSKRGIQSKGFRQSFLLDFSQMFLEAETWCQEYRRQYNAANKEAWAKKNEQQTN